MLPYVLGAIASFAGSVYNNRAAQDATNIARYRNYLLNEQAAENADRRQRALYTDFYSPEAQLRQIKEAGLSPSLLASGVAGGQGATSQMGAGVAGPAPQTYGVNPLEGAQIKLLEAQTRKLNAETDTEKGVNQLGQAKIAELWANAGYKRAAAELKESEKIAQDLQNYITEETTDFSIKRARWLAEGEEERTRQAGYTAEREGWQLRFDQMTFASRIKEQNARVENIIKDTALKQSEINVNQKEVDRLIAVTKQIYEEIENRAIEVVTAKNQWRTYDELVASTINKHMQDIAHDADKNGILQDKNFIDLVTAIIGAGAHMAGVAMGQ